jgi:hypothetical protein
MPVEYLDESGESRVRSESLLKSMEIVTHLDQVLRSKFAVRSWAKDGNANSPVEGACCTQDQAICQWTSERRLIPSGQDISANVYERDSLWLEQLDQLDQLCPYADGTSSGV